MAVFAGLIGKGGKPLTEEEKAQMMKMAAASMAVYVPTMRCPYCHQKSIFIEPLGQKMGRDYITSLLGGVRRTRYVCLNPRGKNPCPINYNTHKTRLVMNSLGELEGSHWFSGTFKNNPFHIDGL